MKTRFSNFHTRTCWLLIGMLLTLPSGLVHADGPLDFLGWGRESGKLAKYQFRLGDDFDVTSMAWSPDGRYIATTGIFTKSVHIWDVGKRKMVKELTVEVPNASYHSLSWSPDSRYLAACAAASLHVYRSENWSEAFTRVRNEASGCKRAVFSSDGTELALLARGMSRYSIAEWHLLSEAQLRTAWALGANITSIEYVPGKHTIVLGGSDWHVLSLDGFTHKGVLGGAFLFEPGAAEPTRRLQIYREAGDQGGAGEVTVVAISPNGDQLAAGTRTGAGSGRYLVAESVQILRLKDGALLAAPLDGVIGLGAQQALAYTPDGRTLLVGYGNPGRAVNLIDTETFQVIDTVHAHDVIYDLSVSPGGRQFAAATGHEVDVYSLPPSR